MEYQKIVYPPRPTRVFQEEAPTTQNLATLRRRYNREFCEASDWAAFCLVLAFIAYLWFIALPAAEKRLPPDSSR